METPTVQKIVDGASSKAARASPKSHIFSLQSALASIFFGFKSRWKTLAVKKKKLYIYIYIYQAINFIKTKGNSILEQ